MSKAIHAVVHGIVQGVAFRYHTRQTANQLGIKGFVRNLPDGTVEVHAEGAKEAVDALVQWLSHGPPSAMVHQVDVSATEPAHRFQTFQILR